MVRRCLFVLCLVSVLSLFRVWSCLQSCLAFVGTTPRVRVRARARVRVRVTWFRRPAAKAGSPGREVVLATT